MTSPSSPTPLRVAITGAGGNIGYAILFRIASGAMFGPHQPVILQLIETPRGIDALKGVVMELEDCAFPLLKGIVQTTDLAVGFKDASWVILVGSVPRKEGMERKDLLNINGKIFVEQGAAIAQHAAADVRVLVVGNPCNTNCLIALSNAKGLPADRFFAMTRLDENRAKQQLALKAGVDVEKVSRLAIWGNHSATMVPDYPNAKIDGKAVSEILSVSPFGAVDKSQKNPNFNLPHSTSSGPSAYSGSSTSMPDDKGEPKRSASGVGASAPQNIPLPEGGARGGSLDEAYLKGEFFTTIQQRGAAIIKARGLSSAASAANAAIETVRDIVTPTPAGDWHSVAVLSDGSYGIPKGIVSSFPIRSDGKKWEIVQGLPIDAFIQERIALSVKELEGEKELVKELI